MQVNSTKSTQEFIKLRSSESKGNTYRYFKTNKKTSDGYTKGGL